MEQLHVITFLSVIPTILFAIAVGKAVVLKKENTLLAQQLTETSNSLELTRQNLATLREKQEKADEFHNSLADAELSTRIQKNRPTGPKSDRNRTTPEKYCYIHSLAEKGLSPDEIAAVLTISTHEARQLVTLAKIAQGN
ncbi:MAG: hypothetical protein ACD_75C02140G0001 [uncultured bacterium]|nr:MAG: hypothetical protein ACD_75C02140G0001 [uncultured bacterium]